MSVFKEHYEKVAVTGGFLILAGLTALTVLNVPAVSEFISKNNGQVASKPQAISDLKGKLEDAQSSAARDHKFLSKFLDVEQKRPLYMFKSIPLFGRKGSTKPIDILDDGASEVHPGIANAEWLKNDLKDLMSYENAPAADPDGDGFTVLEEIKAGTAPNDIKSHPELLSKLKGDAVDVHKYTLKFSTGNAKDIYLEVRDGQGANDDELVAIGGTAFNLKGDGADRYNGRYKYISQVQKRIDGISQPVITLHDLKNKNRVMEIARRHEAKEEDRSVDLRLEALGQNEKVKRFSVGAKFALPFGSSKKLYQVVSIKPSVDQSDSYEVLITKLPVTETSPKKVLLIRKASEDKPDTNGG